MYQPPPPPRTHVPLYIWGGVFTALSIVGFVAIVLFSQAVDPVLGGFLLLFTLMPLGFGLALLFIGAYVQITTPGGRDA